MILTRGLKSRVLRQCLGRPYWLLNLWIWTHLPASVRHLRPVRSYGTHLHTLVRLRAARRQYFGTFFFRNRPELELLRGLVDQRTRGAGLDIGVLACSKGAEVYSIAWTIRSARPDVKLRMHAVDISREVLDFAARGVYSIQAPDGPDAPHRRHATDGDVTWNTCRDQNRSIFERMTAEEMEAMCLVEGDHVKVKSWLKEGIVWRLGDAGDPELVSVLGPQDLVVANRFLCHMAPAAAERCLRNIARLVKPGGYLFVSGIDLDVRTKVAREHGWKPVTRLIREIHEGDGSLRRDWPLEYWGLEPFRDDRVDWKFRYASVFQLPGPPDRESSAMRRSPLKAIGLLDHMGYGNLGDAAIQESVIANIKQRVPDARLVGFSLIPDDTVKRHGIPCYPIRRWHPALGATGRQGDRAGLALRLKEALKRRPIVYVWAKPVGDLLREALFWVRSYRTVRRLDVLVISGGGQLGELWRGPWSHPYTIFKFSVLAKLARRKLYFLNVGAGPLEHPVSRFFARWAVRLADYRSFRDHDSQELVRGLGVRAETHVYPDPAYALEVAGHVTHAPSGSSKPVVGLNPIGFCDPRLWPRKDHSAYQEYLEKLSRFSVWLLGEGYTLRVFTTENSVDRFATNDLRARLHARLSSPDLVRQMFEEPRDSVKDVMRQISRFDFVVTSKFHGIIFCHLLQKPVIALSYHRKMDAAMRSVGQERFCAEIERFDVDWLSEAFRSLVEEGTRIKSGYAAAVEANAARLSRQFDSLFAPSES